MNKRPELLAATCCAYIALSAPVFAGESAAASAAERAVEILAPLKRDLKAALVAGLENGPEVAITVCKIEAPAIAAALSVNDISVGRSSHRLRNPDNAAPAWAEPILRGYLANPAQREPVLVSLADDRSGYVEPIALQPMCLVCHGDSLAPGVAAIIRDEYPLDEATGFAVGDLRGVYWVAFGPGE